MLQYLKQETNMTHTENGAATHRSTLSHCLDLFATVGALRSAEDSEITGRFLRAYGEDPDLAMKILFYARDIRGGLGERRVFRTVLRQLAFLHPHSVEKNIFCIDEFGRWDDLLSLLDTPCEQAALARVKEQFDEDMAALDTDSGSLSLLGKWLPSVNASSAATVRQAKRVARYLGLNDAQYRKALSALRAGIRIIENDLREKNYTFDYSKQPSGAMFKYRKAFLRNDGDRYRDFFCRVAEGRETLHTGTLAPYELIRPFFDRQVTEGELAAIDATWNALEDFTGDENALVVVDGSGSMYCQTDPMPITVALSLGIYYAERNRGAFRNHFITFSENPRLVEIEGGDILEKLRHCARYNEVANTNLQRVFELILNTAVRHGVPQEEMPARLCIISDMEFDRCTRDAGMTNFRYARELFAQAGYKLPEVVFWNVASRSRQQPVTRNEQGVALVSGCSHRIFSMMKAGIPSPYAYMMEVLGSGRYAAIAA